jgi:hypothetical protein
VSDGVQDHVRDRRGCERNWQRAMPNCVIFEFCQAYYPLPYDLLTTKVSADRDGYVSVPTGPGLGVELQPEVELVRKSPFDASSRYAPAREAASV